MNHKKDSGKKTAKGLFELLAPYRGKITLLIVLTLAGNGANLLIPKIISLGIDSYTSGNFVLFRIVSLFFAATLVIFVFSVFQTILQTRLSEKVGYDLRKNLSDKISGQSYSYIREKSPARLLTNLTSDMDSIKSFASYGITSIVSSVFMIAGTVILLLVINWKLALPVIMIIPLIGLTFFYVLRKVRVLFKRSREVIDSLNRVISESIMGAAIIRVLNSQQPEYRKFLTVSAEARDIGISIVIMFATLIPLITFVGNLATLVILSLGGHLVISSQMTLGDFAAFNSYVAMLVFPIIVIGFMSNLIASARASWDRINEVMQSPVTEPPGFIDRKLTGQISISAVSLSYEGKPALKNIHLEIPARSRTAIIGPSAAGKSQLLYLLTGLIKPGSGSITFDGIPLEQLRKETFHRQIGFVFQDSVIFNMSLRENIAFSENVTEESLIKALRTAELEDFVGTLPKKLDTQVSERGTSLSGGQKQRIMLARALALEPAILLLDDFTARVDQNTEQKILKNLRENYPDLTLVSVTQKINPVKDYDQIILLMEGELIAYGNHNYLYASCPEYVQIYESQKSTSHYELQS